MREESPDFSEQESEHIPTPEEVRSVLQELIGKEYREVRRIDDEKGLYLLEVEVPGESKDETIEFAYMRKGRYEGNNAITETEIHVTYFENGVPISGTSAARYVEGRWKIL